MISQMAPQMAAAQIPGRPHRERRRETSSYLGMVIFLATWTMMFAGLFFAYAELRITSSMWPPLGITQRLPLALPGINTVVIVASSLSLWLGMRRLRTGRAATFPRFLGLSILLGMVFLALQLKVWSAVWASGLTQASGTYGGLFYTLTGFHALHVVVGLGLLLWLAVPAFGGRNLTAKYGLVMVVSMFWHFVDVVWVLMFLTVYVL